MELHLLGNNIFFFSRNKGFEARSVKLSMIQF